MKLSNIEGGYKNKYSFTKIKSKVDKELNKRYITKEGKSISDLDFKILTLNGFLNGYNDKLSLKTVPNSTKMTAKEIKIDSFEYLKAKDLLGAGANIHFDMLNEEIRYKKKQKMKNIKHKVNDFLTQRDILAAYKKNIKN